MRAAEAFEQLLKDVSASLRNAGWSRAGKTLYIEKCNNWVLINFQKSQKSTSKNLLFTVNIGICSRRLAEFFTPEKVDVRPAVEDCHWRRRVGLLLPDHSDKWWSIDDRTPLGDLVEEIRSCLEQKAIPELERYACDKDMQLLWLSGHSPGLTDIQRLMYLSVLLKAAGSPEEMQAVLRELVEVSDGKPVASTVKHHVKLLQEGNEQ